MSEGFEKSQLNSIWRITDEVRQSDQNRDRTGGRDSLLSFLPCLLLAQVQTQQTTTSGPATKNVTVERGEVVLVEGNDLVVKMEDGTIRHIPNVPESAKVTVDGRQLGIHDLKPGMKLQRTITTTTTPQTVTTVQTVTGKVWHVTPPISVILTLEDGTNQSFKIPKGQKFNVNGEMVDAFGLKKGMIVTATKIVEVPETVVSQQRKVTGTMPPPPPAPPADVPILVATAEPAPAPQPRRKLPLRPQRNSPRQPATCPWLVSSAFSVFSRRSESSSFAQTWDSNFPTGEESHAVDSSSPPSSSAHTVIRGIPVMMKKSLSYKLLRTLARNSRRGAVLSSALAD